MERTTFQAVKSAALSVAVVLLSSSVSVAERIAGRVEAGGGAIAGANVALWEAGPGSPRKLGETQTGDDGSFRMQYGAGEPKRVLYLIARGGKATEGAGSEPNSATALMVTLGAEPPERVTINDLTTVASV